MLKQTVQYKREQIKQEEIRQKQIEQEKILKEICLNIPKVKKKIIELPNLLLLMQAIEKLSEKQRKTPEEINSLNEMITMYEEKKIALAGHENTNQTLLNVNTVINSTVEPVITINSDNTAEQIVGENSFLKQIQEIQLKKGKKNGVQMKPAQKPKSEHDANGFVMTQDVLEKIKLNSVKPKNSVASIPEDKPPELELKLIKQRALLKEEIISKESVTPVTDLLKSNDAHSESEEEDNFDFYEKICHATGFSSDELDTRTRFINTLSKIFEDKTRPNSTMNELDELLKTLQGFINEPDKEPKTQTPLSMHFNSLRGDAPKIVGVISKPTP